MKIVTKAQTYSAQLTISLPIELRDWLRAEAKRRKCSMSQIVREALEYVQKHGFSKPL